MEVDSRLVRYNLAVSLLEALASWHVRSESALEVEDCSTFFGGELREALNLPKAEAIMMGRRCELSVSLHDAARP